MKSLKRIKLKNNEFPIITIVSSSIIMQKNFADGKSIALIIIDTENNKNIEKAIELHSSGTGEVMITWGKTIDSKYALLRLEMISPTEIKFMIAFDVYQNYGLIDILLNSHLLYIQAGKEGDRLIKNLNKPKLLVEIPADLFDKELQKMSHMAKQKRFNKLNVNKKNIENVIKSFDNEWGNFIKKRFK